MKILIGLAGAVLFAGLSYSDDTTDFHCQHDLSFPFLVSDKSRVLSLRLQNFCS